MSAVIVFARGGADCCGATRRFGEPDTEPILGVVTLEEFRVAADAAGNPSVATVSKIVRAISRAGRPKGRRPARAR